MVNKKVKLYLITQKKKVRNKRQERIHLANKKVPIETVELNKWSIRKRINFKIKTNRKLFDFQIMQKFFELIYLTTKILHPCTLR